MCDYKFNRDFNFQKCPCKDCTKRHAGCHSECAGYKEYKVRMEEFHKNKKREEERYAVSESKIKWIRKKQRKNWNKNSAKV